MTAAAVTAISRHASHASTGGSISSSPRHAKLALRPICHASLRFYRSCAMGSALGRHASHACATGRLSRFTPARGRSITTPSQHVRPALRAARPRFAALLSPCAQGSALLIFSASLCQYKCCALFLPQLAAHLSPLRRCSALCSSSANTLPFSTRRGRHYASPIQAPIAPPLLRKTVPFSRHRRQSQFCPPAAVAYLPQNDSCPVILSVSDTPSGHARISAVERRAWFVYARISAVLRSTSSSYI